MSVEVVMVTNPVWPAVIRYADVDEVVFVRDQAQWNSDLDLNDFRYMEADVLIDSEGQVFHFEGAQSAGPVLLKKVGERLSPQQLSDAVQKHLSAANQCCVSKIVFETYHDCFDLLEKTTEQ